MEKLPAVAQQWRREVLFLANPDLADILGDMDSEFHDFLFFIPQFLNLQVSRFLAWAGPGLSLGPGGPSWLGWLACCAQPWLGLAWACLALAWSSNNNSGREAAAGRRRRPVVVVAAGKAGKRGPGQTKPAKPNAKQGEFNH